MCLLCKLWLWCVQRRLSRESLRNCSHAHTICLFCLVKLLQKRLFCHTCIINNFFFSIKVFFGVFVVSHETQYITLYVIKLCFSFILKGSPGMDFIGSKFTLEVSTDQYLQCTKYTAFQHQYISTKSSTTISIKNWIYVNVCLAFVFVCLYSVCVLDGY